MKLEDFKGKKITVMGLGLNSGGIGTVRFLHSQGARVVVTDIKSKEELKSSLEKLKDLKGIEYIFGQHRPEIFTNTDMIIKTPGVSWNNKYIKMALDKKIPVEVDSSIFFKICKNIIIGVTGTKGKTTTSTMIFEILRSAGKNAINVGIGQVSVLDKLKEIKKDSIIVFELSSWRLSAIGRHNLSPRISVLTNIFQDHLNYYSSMEEYIKDKKFIYLNQTREDFCILNWDNKILREMEKEIKAQIIKCSKEKINEGRSVYVSEGNILVNDGIDEKKIISASEINIRGNHNIENLILAIGACSSIGINSKDISKAIPKLKGIAHRLEFVREIDGVKYYNDTAATTPESAISGINSFSEPVILICGGADKKLDMEEFAKEIYKKAKGVVFFRGEATDKIISAIRKNFPESTSNFLVVDSMEKAIEVSKKEAENGDVILLSPGASSFGIFQNEFDRGNKFKEIVNSF